MNSGKVHIEDAKSSAECAGLTIDNIKSLYLLVNVVLEKPDDNDPAPKITWTLEIYQVKREFNVDEVCKFQFLQAASNSLPFHE